MDAWVFEALEDWEKMISKSEGPTERDLIAIKAQLRIVIRAYRGIVGEPVVEPTKSFWKNLLP